MFIIISSKPSIYIKTALPFPDNVSMDSDGFTIVKKNKCARNKYRKSEKQTTVISGDQNVEVDKNIVKARVKAASDDLLTSEYLSGAIAAIKKCHDTLPLVQIYCFGLGHFSDSVTAKYQFALLLCIKSALHIEDSRIFLGDPVFYEAETEILRSEYNFNVLSENIECHLPCPASTLVFLPHCPKQMTNNLLHSNWSPNLIQNLLILSNSVTNIANSLNSSGVHFITAAVEHKIVQETEIKNCFRFPDIFNDLSLHSFTIPSDLDDTVWRITRPEYDENDVEFIRKKS